MEADVERILYSRAQIDERVKELAAQVVGVYREKDLTVAVVLSGAFMFAADLVRHLAQHVEVVFVRATSYGDGTAPQHAPKIDVFDPIDWSGRDVLIVEDIVDTGHTLAALIEVVTAGGARSVRACAFLEKTSRRAADVDVEFAGFQLEGDEFVVGYGLDLAGRYRNLPYVGVLRAGRIPD